MGRPNRPWYASSYREWCVTFNGRKTRLGVRDPRDEAGAAAAFEALKAGHAPRRAAQLALPADPAARALVLARELLALLPAVENLPNVERRQTALGGLALDLDLIGFTAGLPPDGPPPAILARRRRGKPADEVEEELAAVG